jgi:hypothetical protein
MAWRVIDTGQEVWHVQPAAEMRPNASSWQLTLSFRATKTEREPRSFWTSYPLESNSKSSLFQAADRLTNDTLKEVLAQHLS